jgi:hypothetical protein
MHFSLKQKAIFQTAVSKKNEQRADKWKRQIQKYILKYRYNVKFATPVREKIEKKCIFSIDSVY